MKLGWPYLVARKVSFMQVDEFTFGNFAEFLAFGGLDVFL